MPIDRTAYNALVDDDGTNTVGTVWNKTQIKNVLLDPIDQALSSALVQTITLTGLQNNVAITPGIGWLRCNNASLLTLSGLAGGLDGQVLTISAIGNGQVNLTHNDGSSSTGNRLYNVLTSGPTSLITGGAATYRYDAASAIWRLVQHHQGGPIACVPTAGGTSTYTVQSTYYTVSGRVVTFQIRLAVNAIGTGSLSTLATGIPYTVLDTVSVYLGVWSNLTVGFVFVGGYIPPGSPTINFTGLTAAAASLPNANILKDGSTLNINGSFVAN
jgi:hypothetical protein